MSIELKSILEKITHPFTSSDKKTVEEGVLREPLGKRKVKLTDLEVIIEELNKPYLDIPTPAMVAARSRGLPEKSIVDIEVITGQANKPYFGIPSSAMVAAGSRNLPQVDLSNEENLSTNDVTQDNVEDHYTNLRAPAIVRTSERNLSADSFTVNLQDFAPTPGYTNFRVLGQGAHGKAILCHYKYYKTPNSNPEIEKLCDEDGFVVIKMALDERGIEAIEEEKQITAYLFNKEGRYTHACPIELKENSQTEPIPAILSRYTGFTKDPLAIKPKSKTKSYDLKKFWEKLKDFDFQRLRYNAQGDLVESGQTIQKTYRFIANDIDILAAGFFDGMSVALSDMHKNGVLHLDVAPRNFLVGEPVLDAQGNVVKIPVKATDFGASANFDWQVGYAQKLAGDRLPFRWMDLATLNTAARGVRPMLTARTDLMSVRISLLNLLTVGLDYEDTAAIYLNRGDDIMQHIFSAADGSYQSDAQLLNKYVENLNQFITERKDEIVFTKQYFTSTGNASDWQQEIHSLEQDNQYLMEYFTILMQPNGELSQEQRQIFTVIYKTLADKCELLEQRLAKFAKLDNKLIERMREIENVWNPNDQAMQLEYRNLFNQRALIGQQDSTLGAFYKNIVRPVFYNTKQLQALLDNSQLFSLRDKELCLNRAEESKQVIARHVNEINNKTTAIQRTEMLLAAYQDYLLNPPWGDFEQPYHASELIVDKLKLLKANEKFLLRALQQRTSAQVFDEQNFKMSIKRLLELQVTSTFQHTELYQLLQNYAKQTTTHVNIREEINSVILEEAEKAANDNDFSPQDWVDCAEKVGLNANKVPPPSPANPKVELTVVEPLTQNVEVKASVVEEISKDNIIPAEKPIAKAKLVEPVKFNFSAKQIEKALTDLTQINYELKKHSADYNSAFYSSLNPLRHRFVKSNRENFENLQPLVLALSSILASVKDETNLIVLFNAENRERLQQINQSADTKEKLKLKEIDSIFRKSYRKLQNYHNYLSAVVENFTERLSTLKVENVEAASRLAHDLAVFNSLLFSDEHLKKIQQLFALDFRTINERTAGLFNTLADKLAAAKLLQEKFYDADLTDSNAIELMPIKMENKFSIQVVNEDKIVPKPQPKNTTVAVKKPLLEEVSTERNWEAVFKKEKRWICERSTENVNQLILQPKKTELTFTFDVAEASFTYKPKPVANLPDKELTKQQEKLVDAMVRAFAMTKNKKADLTGNKLLCDMALKQLQRMSHIEEIKVNGMLVYNKAPTIAARLKHKLSL